jgi:hypothetical protein
VCWSILISSAGRGDHLPTMIRQESTKETVTRATGFAVAVEKRRSRAREGNSIHEGGHSRLRCVISRKYIAAVSLRALARN